MIFDVLCLGSLEDWVEVEVLHIRVGCLLNIRKNNEACIQDERCEPEGKTETRFYV